MRGDGGRDLLYANTAASPDGSLMGDTLDGNERRDTLVGSAGDDVLSGGDAAPDILMGGGGRDTADYSTVDTFGKRVRVDLSLEVQQNTGGGGKDTLIDVENVTGTEFGDVLVGDKAGNELIGLVGDDRLEGANGDDTLRGG